MGAGDSKLSFKKGVFRLAEDTDITATDPYWLSFWELPESADDVFTLFSAADIRRTRDTHLENLETLILAITSRLIALRNHPSFPDPEQAPERDALNCIRILTRLMPFIYEAEQLENWEEKFFWGGRRRRVQKTTGSEVIFDESNPEQEEEAEFEDAPPLMEELLDCLVDLLFFQGFTLPPVQGTKGGNNNKVSYAIWQSGVGCNSPVGTTREGENNKIEILRLLLAITSKAMYMPASVLPIKGVRVLTYLVTNPDKRSVLSVLCSLLNTTLKYNPASWRVPYDHVVFTDPRQVLVTYSIQFLLVLLLYPVPEASAGPVMKNNYRHYLGRLHRTQDFQFCVDGMTRILNQPIQATTSYLPGSQKSLKWAPEMMMLFWEALQCNKRFRSFIIDTDRVHDFVILIMYYALEYRLDQSKSGVVRMCVFVLQTLSTEPKFGKSLNKRFEGQNSLPASVRIASFSGTYADYLIISIYTLITTSKGKLSAVYPALLAIVANIAPHILNLSSAASTKLIQLYASMSAPTFLLANETNHSLLHSLLESMNAIIEHQYSANSNFIYALLRSHKRFEALRTFTLEAGQEALDRENMLRKDRGEPGVIESPKVSFSMSEMQRPRRPPTMSEPGTPMTPHNPSAPDAFEIGDDSDEEDEDEGAATSAASAASSRIQQSSSPAAEDPRSPTDTTPSGTEAATPETSQSPSVTGEGDTEDAVPLQLRGMSEKARGKLPEGAFQRQGSTTSLASHMSGTATPIGFGFSPSQGWIDSWLPLLPLHTILTVIQQLSPHLNSIITPPAPPPVSSPTSPTSGTPPVSEPPLLEKLRHLTLHGIEPLPIKTHMFNWSPLALGWYESLLWGFIFVSERGVSKGSGTVGVWNGTNIKLFKLQEMQREGPSLRAPGGAVEAVGLGLVERLGQVGERVVQGVQERRGSTQANGRRDSMQAMTRDGVREGQPQPQVRDFIGTGREAPRRDSVQSFMARQDREEERSAVV
ncbi:high-temperature-induced dauer-formation protein-domain-containing protein [Pyronema domesticum]|uniref:Similar to Protein hid-1 homolog acc. no. Q8IV36 n=1 Tax=Pyronema omphalodes (strain CBS 100304) TaxID=1076935 RepID=U4L1J5_PYROM|nr:high-temperature-induced dauer-formation protein-domain-containing protein [Pyronema domesticum]CCX09737.1 Similar to Protein hid-1 homolog; acc. no. Q8IV36 [Pyronema omphalodes CBS 100304]